MAGSSSQNPARSSSSLRRDFSSASLALPYTGGVAAAQSAVDYTADPDELITDSLEMHSGTTPRSLPPGPKSRSQLPRAFSAAFPGDSFQSSSHYILSGDSQSGSQNLRTESRQSFDHSSEASHATLHFDTEIPWNPLPAAEDPSGTIATGAHTPLMRTPDRTTHQYQIFRESGFHDSALGTFTAPSHDETHSLLSSTPTDMDDNQDYSHGFNPPPQEVDFNVGFPQQQPDHPAHAPPPVQAPARPRNQRQPRTTEELTCDQCGHIAKTPSDLKKHQARHDAPWKCEEEDCPRAIRGFATINDLQRHQKSVHGQNGGNTKYYKCFAANCAKSDKRWPRLDNFKQHLVRMHEDEDVEMLVNKSKEWYETEIGSSGSAQSAAITSVLRSQEQAARGQSQSKKRRRSDSPSSPAQPPQKRPTRPALQTQGMSVPAQDFTRLSPMSAHAMSRPPPVRSMGQSPQSARRNPPVPSFPLGSSQLTWSPDQLQRTSAQAQLQGVNRAISGPATYDRRQTMSNVPSVMTQQPQQYQTAFQQQWTNNTDYTNADAHKWATQTTIGQQPPVQQRRPQVQAHQRPHTAPDGGNFAQIQLAFMKDTHPIPPGQDDFDVNQMLIGTGTSLQRSTPASSNEPITPTLQCAPTSAGGNDSDESDDDDDGTLKVEGDFKLKLREFLRGFDSKTDRRTMLEGGLPHMLHMMSSQGSASVSGMSQRSNVGSSSSRAGGANHQCPNCHKNHARASDLKKHMKRHSRPYGCVLDDCYKRFGSKNDLKRHGDTHPEQKECYRCDGKHTGPDGQSCQKSFYSGRDNYKRHLQQYFSGDPNLIEQKANQCRIPANNVGRYWCGFCNAIQEHEHVEHVASATARLSHIDSHFSKGQSVADWIELGGNGLTKEQVEQGQKQEKARQMQTRNQEKGLPTNEHDDQGSSSSSSSENREPATQTQVVPQSRPQQWPAQGMRRSTSNASAYSQMPQQQRAPQQQRTQQRPHSQQGTGHQMQRARSHNVAMQQQAVDHRDPPQRQYNASGQKLATQATCCYCALEWPLGLFSRDCTACGHKLCGACKTS